MNEAEVIDQRLVAWMNFARDAWLELNASDEGRRAVGDLTDAAARLGRIAAKMIPRKLPAITKMLLGL